MTMKTDDKIERLLDMIEHPEQYTENEIKELLEDDECRDYYNLMVKTDNAYLHHSENDVEEALKKFEAKHTHRFSWRSMAAVIISVVMISGIAYAAISLSRRATTAQPAKTEVPASVAVTKTKTQSEEQKTDTIVMKEKSFDDVELETILSEISTYYNVKVEYHSDASKHLRLHFHWDKTQTLEEVVETMNHFEKVSITLFDDKMEVE
jgi:hypothetical protein